MYLQVPLLSTGSRLSSLSSILNDSFFLMSGFQFIVSSLCENFIGILCKALSSRLSKACIYLSRVLFIYFSLAKERAARGPARH